MARSGLSHSVSESWQCSTCLKLIYEKDPTLCDCGESFCGQCLLKCKVTEDRVTCEGCSEMYGLQSEEQVVAHFTHLLLEEFGIQEQLSPALEVAFKTLVRNLLHTENGPLPLCLSYECEAKWKTLVKAQVAVIREAYECLSLANHGVAERREEAEMWTMLNRLIDAVSERDGALKALLGSTMAVQRPEILRSQVKVRGRPVTSAKLKRRRRFEIPQKVVKDYKLQRDVRLCLTQPSATGWAK